MVDAPRVAARSKIVRAAVVTGDAAQRRHVDGGECSRFVDDDPVVSTATPAWASDLERV
jgi:hypothetical protein